MAWESKYLRAGAGLQVACWDLDSSVRSTVQRRHMVPDIRAGRKTWHDYSLACADDEPIEGAVALMRLFRRFGLANFAVSGCSERALDLTVDWAAKHEVPLDDYLLRPDDTPNEEWKVAAVRLLKSAGLNVVLFVEDWAPAARYIREHTGVPVLGVNPFDPGTCLAERIQLGQELSQELESEGLNLAQGTVSAMASRIFARLAGEHL
jgi:hypothetical protein